ncbi:MAG: hypothetical protein ACO1PI_08170 [Bacteroidota bacterium]
MKKYVTAIVAMVCVANALACEVCGCAVGGSTMGILPRFGRHFVGVKYNYSSFTSKHQTLFNGQPPVYSTEYFTTVTLWGRYVPHKRVQLFAFAPYTYFARNEEGVSIHTEGIGDITLMANYVLLNTTDSAKRKFKHALQIGGGIKLPLGATDRRDANGILPQNMQQGTGSFDVPINLLYTIRYKKAGINVEAGYTVNNAGANEYWYGNKFNGALRLFYWQDYRNTSFLPQIGFNYEHRERDWYKPDGFLNFTGGNALSATAAADVYFYKMAVGVGVKQPLIYNWGGGSVTEKISITSSIVYMF